MIVTEYFDTVTVNVLLVELWFASPASNTVTTTLPSLSFAALNVPAVNVAVDIALPVVV